MDSSRRNGRHVIGTGEANEAIVVAVEVFPAFRGQEVCPRMLTAVFAALGAMGLARAY